MSQLKMREIMWLAQSFNNRIEPTNRISLLFTSTHECEPLSMFLHYIVIIDDFYREFHSKIEYHFFVVHLILLRSSFILGKCALFKENLMRSSLSETAPQRRTLYAHEVRNWIHIIFVACLWNNQNLPVKLN